MSTAIIPDRVLVCGEISTNVAVICEGERIKEIVPKGAVPNTKEIIALPGCTLMPGYIDVQVNGGGGVLFNDTPTVDGLRKIAAGHAKFGTTGLMPTIISTDLETISRAIAAVDAAIQQRVPGILGIHLEGPFLSPKRRGIHNPKEFPILDSRAIEILTSLRHGKTMVTLAPDVVSPEDVSRLTNAGVIVCVGHSDASYEQTTAALNAGASGFTHLYNAMSPLNHRAPGVVGAALDDKESWCGLITDGHHVHPAAVRIAFACRGADKLMLVTDAMPPVGAEASSFELQGRTIRVENGCCYGPDGTLAGSATNMATIVKKAIEFLGIDLITASKLASRNAASFLRLADDIGVIAPGTRADFVAIDDAMTVRHTLIGGMLA